MVTTRVSSRYETKGQKGCQIWLESPQRFSRIGCLLYFGVCFDFVAQLGCFKVSKVFFYFSTDIRSHVTLENYLMGTVLERI